MAGSKIEWRPISTAPRDLTIVRLRLENGVGNNREPGATLTHLYRVLHCLERHGFSAIDLGRNRR